MDRRPLRVAFWMLSVALALVSALTISVPDSIRLANTSPHDEAATEGENPSVARDSLASRRNALMTSVQETSAGLAEPRHVGDGPLTAVAATQAWPVQSAAAPMLSDVLADSPIVADGVPVVSASRGSQNTAQNRLTTHGVQFEELPAPAELPPSAAWAGKSEAAPAMELLAPLKELTSELSALRGEFQSAARRDGESQRESLESLRSELRTFAESQRSDALRSEMLALAQRQQKIELALQGTKDENENATTDPRPGGQRAASRVELSPSADDPNLWTARFLNADPAQAVRRISEAGGWNVVVSSSIAGTVTVSLAHVRLEDVLAAVAQSLDGVVVEEGGYRLLVPASQAALRRRTTERTVAKVFRLNHLAAMDVLPLVQPLLTPGVGEAAVSTAPEDGALHPERAQSDVLLVLDYEEALKQIEALIAEVDVAPAQIEIDAVITTIRSSERTRWGAIHALRTQGLCQDCMESGSTANRRAAKHCGQFRGSARQLLRHLEQLGELHVEATPSLRVLNRQVAHLTVGREIGFERWQAVSRRGQQKERAIDFLPGTAHLCVRPFLTGNDTVRLQVHPRLSHVTVDPATGVPRRELAEVETDLSIPLGCTAIIGGLTLHRHEQGLQPATRTKRWLQWPTRKVGDVEETETLEVVILLTPRLVSESTMGPEAIIPEAIPPQPMDSTPPRQLAPIAPEPFDLPAEPAPAVEKADPFTAFVTRAELNSDAEATTGVQPILFESSIPLPIPGDLWSGDAHRWPVPPAPAPPLRLPSGL